MRNKEVLKVKGQNIRKKKQQEFMIRKCQICMKLGMNVDYDVLTKFADVDELDGYHEVVIYKKLISSMKLISFSNIMLQFPYVSIEKKNTNT